MPSIRRLLAIPARIDPFTRWVALFGLLTLAVLWVTTSALIGQVTTRDTLENARAEVETTVSSLVVHGLLESGFPDDSSADLADWDGGSEFAEFVTTFVLSDRVSHVIVHDRTGLVVYSDVAELIGTMHEMQTMSDDGSQATASTAWRPNLDHGHTYDEGHGHSHDEPEPEQVEEEHNELLLEVATPLVLPGGSEPIGMLSIYLDGEPLRNAMSGLNNLVRIAVGSVLAVSYGGLLLLVSNRSGVIRSHQSALEDRAIQLEKAAIAVRTSERRHRALVARSADGILTVRRDGEITYGSPSAAELMGVGSNGLLSSNLSGLITSGERDHVREVLSRVAQSPGASEVLEISVARSNERITILEATLTNMLDDESVAGVVVNCRDITERKQHERQLRRMAFHDRLTGLVNRAVFDDRLERAVTRGARGAPQPAVLLIDLDRFKLVNDEMGHAAGDQALIETAHRIEQLTAAGATVARLGGDEFAVLIEHPPNDRLVIELGESIAAVLGVPFNLDGKEVRLGASVGIALGAGPGERDAEALLRAADTAMYRVKKSHPGGVAVFEPEVDTMSSARLDLEAELRHAVENGEFSLVYQPQYDVGSGELVGFEALLRWNHPTQGLRSPMEFMAAAETTGEIVPIGRWVLREAISANRTWRDKHPGLEPVISVNTSPVELRETSYVSFVAELLESTGLPPSALRVEVTEIALTNSSDEAIGQLRALRQIGVRVAIDNFGMGFSTLASLRELPVDLVKIDRSFVADCDTDAEVRRTVDAMTTLAHSVGLHVVAGGIEQEGELDTIQTIGGEEAQGYYFSRPLSGEDALELLDGLAHGQEPRSAA